LYKALDFIKFQVAAHAMPDKYHKWPPKFQSNNVILAQTHIRAFEDVLTKKEVENGDVVMRLFVLSFKEDARIWFRNPNDASVKTWDTFKALFLKQWEIKNDGRMLLGNLDEVKNRENETVKEFIMRFQKFIDKIPEDIRPKGGVVLLYCVNAFEGNFGCLLRDKDPKDL
jgi:hypothetical protein